ncbi:hypothetical protein AAEO56_15400 [Flavobacterium sp. DGU11]|uniref:Uncharacterized protein n=1 Tax=Flavobacterium arundinis TaxID=3139143 RepID=A0ABU9HZR2_9FLAO
MEDKELYDFFKGRKQSFDEAPGDALWAKIENGLNEAPQAATDKPGLSLLKKLLIMNVLGVVVAIIWMVAYSPKAGEETAKPQDAGVTGHKSNNTKVVEDATVHSEYDITDTIKKVKLPVLQPGAASLAPTPGVLRPADAVIISKDTLRLTSHAVKMETVSPAGYKPSGEVLQIKENTKIKLTDAPTLKPESIMFGEKLIAKDSLMPQAVLFKADSVKKEKQQNELEVVVLSPGSVRQGTVNEVILTPADSLRSELKVIQTDTKTEPGRVTITIKQALTKEQFDSYTEKVKKESNHKAGTIIIIIAPGHKTFRYKVPKPVGELGP